MLHFTSILKWYKYVAYDVQAFETKKKVPKAPEPLKTPEALKTPEPPKSSKSSKSPKSVKAAPLAPSKPAAVVKEIKKEVEVRYSS